jgi:RNA polymerase sigma factor (sigma-70 family)
MHSERVFKSNDSVFAGFYQRHAPEIFTYLRLHTPTNEDAEDLLVDVFLAAFEHEQLQTIPLEKQRAWLWRVARYKTVDLYRGTKRRSSTRLEQLAHTLYFNEELEPEQYAIRSERYAQVSSHIQRLPAAQQQVIYLHFVHGLRSKGIAQIMDKREGTVRMLLSRALNTLRATANTEEYHGAI